MKIRNLKEAVIFDDLDDEDKDKEQLDDCMDSSGISEFTPEHVGVRLQRQTESKAHSKKINLSQFKKAKLTEDDDLDEDYINDDVVTFDDVLDSRYAARAEDNDKYLQQFLRGLYNEPAEETEICIACTDDDSDDCFNDEAVEDEEDFPQSDVFHSNEDSNAEDFENKLCKDIRESTKPVARTSLLKKPQMQKVAQHIRRTSLLHKN